ncbi:MAG: DUF748 domain-containing protein, partial [Candidatus Omnitrophica bacterium]|nr:DUF748 domain-containing protein [Candidatus Omnitrophota bacterium]
DILDKDKQSLIAFDRLFVRLSFLKLFQKTLFVESVELDSLNINAALLQGGHINLMDLIPVFPPQTVKAAPVSAAASPARPAPSLSTPSLPLVIVKSFVLRGGRIHFIDRTTEPNFSTTLNNMELRISHISTNPDEQAKVDFQAQLDKKGKISSEALLKPLAQPLELEATLAINQYAMQVLSPYVSKYTGHQLKSGKMDFRMDYNISANKLTASHKLLIQHFEFGDKVKSKDALPLPFGLAVALLEDPQGRININLPVTGDMKDPKFHYFHLIGQVSRDFFLKLVTKPFSCLASMMGYSESSTDELGYVRFLPGRADLSAAEKEKLGVLIKGLKERPRLRLEINGSYDLGADWKAMQHEIFTKDYNQLKKTTTRPEASIYELLYQRRFGIRALWALAKKYKKGIGDYDDVRMDREIKRRLIESAPADKGALTVLAQARAQMVYNTMVSLGFDAKRLTIGQAQSVQSSMGYIPLEFALTVFE